MYGGQLFPVLAGTTAMMKDIERTHVTQIRSGSSPNKSHVIFLCLSIAAAATCFAKLMDAHPGPPIRRHSYRRHVVVCPAGSRTQPHDDAHTSWGCR